MVDYRRVNARVLRAVYFVRSADGVVAEVAGSMWMSFVDACEGFNQVANTRRAREMLAILSRSGEYLPVCLTFGPTNGPEDFAFATDRVFAPGRGREMRFCSKWQIYADDITVRSGRWLDGTYYSDKEYAGRVKEAAKRENDSRPLLKEAFEALGFNPEHLGVEQDGKQTKPKAKARAKTQGEQATDGLGVRATGNPSPTAHTSVFSFVCVLLFGLGGFTPQLRGVASFMEQGLVTENGFYTSVSPCLGHRAEVSFLVRALVLNQLHFAVLSTHCSLLSQPFMVGATGSGRLHPALGPAPFTMRSGVPTWTGPDRHWGAGKGEKGGGWDEGKDRRKGKRGAEPWRQQANKGGESSRPRFSQPAADHPASKGGELSRPRFSQPAADQPAASSAREDDLAGPGSYRGRNVHYRDYTSKFHNGMTAYEFLGTERCYRLRSAMTVKRKNRLESWTYVNCVSWAMTLAGRHAAGKSRELNIRDDGFVYASQFLDTQVARDLYIDQDLMKQVMAKQNAGHEKDARLGFILDADGSIFMFRAQQGHSEETGHCLRLDSIYTEMTYRDPRMPRLGLHGCPKHSCHSILTGGLLCGGERGGRADVFIVSRIMGDQKQAGLREGSDAMIQIDMWAYQDKGGMVYLTEQGAYVTRGLVDPGTAQNRGIPPEFLIGAYDIRDGREVVSLDRPALNKQGRPIGAVSSVPLATVTVPAAQAEAMIRQVAWTEGCRTRDLNDTVSPTAGSDSSQLRLPQPAAGHAGSSFNARSRADAPASSSSNVWDRAPPPEATSREESADFPPWSHLLW